MNLRRVMRRFIVIIIMVLTSLSVINCDETKALLEVKVNHVVKPEVRINDFINYTCEIRQKETSQLDAVDLVVEIMLPLSIQLVAPTVINTPKYNTVVHSKNRVDYVIPALPLQSQVRFQFAAVINDDNLTPGLHYASTAMKVLYKSKRSNKDITPNAHEISIVAEVPYFIASCTKPLGISNGAIKFYQLSASSTQVDLKPNKARANGVDDAWCARNGDQSPYIQVYLNRFARVTGVATWGRKSKPLWVKKYTLEFSKDGIIWRAYTDTGITKQFDANFDQETKAMHWLIEPFEANYVRLYPMQWFVGVCMRFELYGCDLASNENCIKPLGMEDGRIPLAALTTKLQPAYGFEDTRNWSRLNAVVTKYPHGWKAHIAEPDYLQIDLGSANALSAIAVQGGYGHSAPYVTKFRVSYSLDKEEWTRRPSVVGDKQRYFPGSEGGQLPDMVFFSPPFTARYVRIEPTEPQVKTMRFELYGCLADDHMTEPNAINLSRRSVLIDEGDGFIYVCIYTNDKAKSICKRSKDGQHWKSLGLNIMGVIHQSRSSRRLYGVDRKFHKAFSDDNGDTWFTITEREWRRQLADLEVNSRTNIDDILTTVIPESRYTWTTQKGDKWGVSGDGIHVMGSRSVAWKLCAAWKCFGL